jgi:hypothetical protein
VIGDSLATIVTCRCGAKVRLPAAGAGRTFSCPKCRQDLIAGERASISFPAAATTASAAMCPICQSAVQPAEALVTCESCRQVHHDECWSEVGGCSTYGCPRAPAVTKDEQSAAQPRTAWGDTKTCPVCAETIQSIALRCRYCRTDFGTVDPITMDALHGHARNLEGQKSLRGRTGVIFAASLIGCLAPLMLIVSLATVLPQRKQLAKAGPFYLTLGYAGIAISSVYCVLIMLFLLFSRH